MSETTGLEPTVHRLLDIVQGLSREYQQFAKTVGADTRVPNDLREEVLAHSRDVLANLSVALNEASAE